MATIERRQSLGLTAASTAYLLEELAELGRSSRRGQQRQVGLAAITFRPGRKGRDGIPDGLMPLDGFKLLSISYGWSAGRRGPRPSIRLGIYRARFEVSAGVPIRFVAEEIHELTRPRSLTEPHPHLTAIRSALLLHQAVEDGDRGDFRPSLDWPRFFYGFDLGIEPEFVGLDRGVADANGRVIEGLRAWPAELFAGSGDRLRCCPPRQVFASLAHLKGRELRNPSFGLLKRHGLLPEALDYRHWLGTVIGRRDGLGSIPDPRSGRGEAGRLRGLIESHMVADGRREGSMLGELGDACVGLGVRLPEGEERRDRLAELLDNPWSGLSVAYAARIQRVRLSGSSSSVLGDGLACLELEGDPVVCRGPRERVARLGHSRC